MGERIDGKDPKEILMEKQLEETKNSSKIQLKDIIPWVIAIIGIVVAILIGIKS